jgi:CheY-like chemotaxis protein
MPSYRILVVDDVSASAELLKRLLQNLGQNVYLANDVASAIELAKESLPEIVISDIAMPEIDGLEFARRMRHQPGMEGVIMVALTGFGEREHREQTSAAGYNYHLVKPVSVEALEELLASVGSPSPIPSYAQQAASAT